MRHPKDREANTQKREYLIRILGQFATFCGIVGYFIGVVGVMALLYSLEYPLWFLILALPFAIVGGLPFGVPIGLMAGIPFIALFSVLIDWFYPEDENNPVDENKRGFTF